MYNMNKKQDPSFRNKKAINVREWLSIEKRSVKIKPEMRRERGNLWHQMQHLFM